MGKNISNETVQFEKHQPERRRGARGRVLCGCCCCSCCLHSVVGLIAAAVATPGNQRPSGGSVVRCYWIVLILLTVVLLIFSTATAMGLGLIIALFCLPLVQLAASLLTLVWIGIRSANSPDKKADMLTLGRITLWSFLGALAGGVAMIVGFKMFN